MSTEAQNSSLQLIDKAKLKSDTPLCIINLRRKRHIYTPEKEIPLPQKLKEFLSK